MKNIVYSLLLIIPILIGCSEKTEFTLKGQITGLDSDTLLAYYQVPEYKTDTILCKKGAFEYTFTPDTLTVFNLILNAEESLPIFAEKGEVVEVEGTVDELDIKGTGENLLMSQILTLLRNTPEESITNLVDSLIKTNYESFTNIYLMDKYYRRNVEPDYNHIQQLMDSQSGIIKDTPYFMDLQSEINAFTKQTRTQQIITVTGQDRNGKPIKWASNRNNYILLDFWASWNAESVNEQDSLETVLKALKKKNFLVYSISLDMDKETWLKASDRDTTQWRQSCDFKGWNNNIIKSQNIQTLPANLLLDKNKRIIARDIRGKELIEKVKKLIENDEEKEKERKKAEKKRKRR